MYVVWIFLSIHGISAIKNQLELQLITHSDTNNCEICDLFDCITLSNPFCAYYGEIYDGLGNIDHYEHEEEKDDLNDEIENMILLYVDKASTVPYQECIPIISQYTNCNKVNIYTGCTTCICDVFGKWNCTWQCCARDDHLNVDHRTLAVVMERLEDYKNSHLNERFKRSANDINYDNNQISYEDLLKWIYGEESFEVKEARNNSEVISIQNNTNKEIFTHKPSTVLESDLLVFDDLLNSVNIDRDDNLGKDIRHSEAIFYKNNDPYFFDIIKEIGNVYVTEANYLKMSKNEIENVTSVHNTVSTNTNSDENSNVIFTNDNKENNNRILKKRDISLDANKTDVTSVNYNKTINKMEESQQIILSSLNKILFEKQNELDELTNIKEKLIIYLKSFGNISISNNFILNNVTNSSKDKENPNIYFYQFEKISREDLRKHDPNILEKYLKKLKQDIYEVIRDIAGIQRFSNSSIPRDLNVLIRAMKYYVNKENERKKLSKTKYKQRRQFDVNEKKNQPLDIIIKIIQVLNNTSTNDVLESASHDARSILNRIIKKINIDDFTISNSKVDFKYDVLSNLRYIGNKWRNLSLYVTQIPIDERLYSLKFLHIMLSKDICKINAILKLMKFTNSRRMTPFDEVLNEKVVSKIINDLQQISSVINKVIKLQPKQKFKNKNYKSNAFKETNNGTRKKSLFQKIKKLLKSSKKELQNLFHKNISKSEIVNYIGMKKIDEITKKKLSEYEEIMQRWQNNFNVTTVRRKRSAGEFQKFMNKIKHIIPSYLRGKIKPALDKNKQNKTKLTTRKIKHRGRGKKKSVSTTPKVNLSKNLKRNHTKRQH